MAPSHLGREVDRPGAPVRPLRSALIGRYSVCEQSQIANGFHAERAVPQGTALSRSRNSDQPRPLLRASASLSGPFSVIGRKDHIRHSSAREIGLALEPGRKL